MDDMERYGDYNDTDDGEGGGRSVVGLIIKILIAVVCLTVVGFIAFRIWIFNYYPDSVSKIIYTDTLREHYIATEGNIGAFTQDNNVKYDDPNDGNFFFDKLVIVPSADHLQVAIRYNTSLMDNILAEYGVELDKDALPTDLFDFKLARTKTGYVTPEGSDEPVPVEVVGTVGATVCEKNLMYRYCRIAFDGVDFGLDEGESAVGWFRLEITVKGRENIPTFMLPVYVEQYGMREYTLTEAEVPQ